MATQTIEMQRLKFSTKLYYGLASLGTAMVSSIFAALLPIFYQDYLGLSARWIGIALAVYAVWNAINDPIFGFITDNTGSKLGRRIPYMRFTAPYLGLTFILVWFAPEGMGEMRLFWWMLVTMLLYDTAYTIIGLVHGALMPELTESDMERNQLSISGALFGIRSIVELIPGLVMLIGGVIMFYFPIQGERLVQLKQTILELHSEKEGKLAQIEGHD